MFSPGRSVTTKIRTASLVGGQWQGNIGEGILQIGGDCVSAKEANPGGLRGYLFEVTEGAEEFFVAGNYGTSIADAASLFLDEDGQVAVKVVRDWPQRSFRRGLPRHSDYPLLPRLHPDWRPLVDALENDLSGITAERDIFSMNAVRKKSRGADLYLQILNLGSDEFQVEIGPGSEIMAQDSESIEALWDLYWEKPTGSDFPNIFFISPGAETARARAIVVVLTLAGPLGFSLQDSFVLHNNSGTEIVLNPASSGFTPSIDLAEGRRSPALETADQVPGPETPALEENDNPIDRLVTSSFRISLLSHLFSEKSLTTFPLLRAGSPALQRRLRLIWHHHNQKIYVDRTWFRVVFYRHWKLHPQLNLLHGGADFNFGSYLYWINEPGVNPDVVTRIVFQEPRDNGAWKSVPSDAKGLFFPSRNYAEALAGISSPGKDQLERYRALVPCAPHEDTPPVSESGGV